ncbi:MAG: hypothetical protein R3D98_12475 [Candidatus Krumholzibacteriia bacterium]
MMRILSVVVVALALPAVAQTGPRWLDSADWHRWTWAQEIGGRPAEHREVGGERTGGGSSLLSGTRLKSGGLSLLVPGLGQLRNGQRDKGLVMLGVEAVIWGTYVGFHHHAGTLTDDYEAWAEIYAGVPGGRTEDFYQSLGRYDNSDAWYDARLREARAFGEPTPDPPAAADQWQWRSEQARRDYQKLRADANSAYDRRDMMILFAIVNRALSVFDAVRNGDRAAGDGTALGGTVLGTDLALEVSAPLAVPAARFSAGWSF